MRNYFLFGIEYTSDCDCSLLHEQCHKNFCFAHPFGEINVTIRMNEKTCRHTQITGENRLIFCIVCIYISTHRGTKHKTAVINRNEKKETYYVKQELRSDIVSKRFKANKFANSMCSPREHNIFCVFVSGMKRRRENG